MRNGAGMHCRLSAMGCMTTVSALRNSQVEVAERQSRIGRQRRATQALKLRAALAALDDDEARCAVQLAAAQRALEEVLSVQAAT